jgi:hypothetical protein
LFTAKINSKFADIIDSNSIVIPVLKEKQKDKNLELLSENPIDIDVSYLDEFLFRLHFKFLETKTKHASLSMKGDKNSGTMEFVLENISAAQRSIAPPTAVEVAKDNNGNTFYLSFIVTSSPYAINLSYTIYLVKEEK